MFGVYVLIDEKHVLDAQKVFVSMALINILKTPLSQLPFAMSTTMQVKQLIFDVFIFLKKLLKITCFFFLFLRLWFLSSASGSFSVKTS